jgi:hypothetical protein
LSRLGSMQILAAHCGPLTRASIAQQMQNSFEQCSWLAPEGFGQGYDFPVRDRSVLEFEPGNYIPRSVPAVQLAFSRQLLL